MLVKNKLLPEEVRGYVEGKTSSFIPLRHN